MFLLYSFYVHFNQSESGSLKTMYILPYFLNMFFKI